MRQDESRCGSDEPASPASRGKARFWLQAVAAGALALTLGLGTTGPGQAYAETLTSTHEGGQSSDKVDALATASAEASHGAAKASSFGRSDAEAGITDPQPGMGLAIATAKDGATYHVDAQSLGTGAWTRTITRTATNQQIVSSTTRSKSIAFDDEGNRVVSIAVARARAPNNVEAVESGAGKVFAKTSVDVTGNGTGTASAGGSIGVSGGNVKASTWGETSAEVF
jgi:hypothetical protein